MPPRRKIERLLCIGDPEHVAENERRLSAALTVFAAQTGRQGSTWTPEDSVAWRAWKAAYGLKSTIVFDHLGMGSCAVCGEPMVKAKFYDDVEGYRQRVTMLPEHHVAPQPGQWVFEPEKLTRLYIVGVTDSGMVEMSYRPGDPIAVAADREDFLAHFEIIGLDAPAELPPPPTKQETSMSDDDKPTRKFEITFTIEVVANTLPADPTEAIGDVILEAEKVWDGGARSVLTSIVDSHGFSAQETT